MSIFPKNLSLTKSTTPDKVDFGLPGYCYFDSEIFAQEMRTLWRSTWQFVGRESDLPNSGDYLTYLVGDQPIFVIRTPKGGLQAMHNVCPHRGARLLDGQCQIYIPYTTEKPNENYKSWGWEPHGASSQDYIFPNLMVNTAKDHVSVFWLFPLSPVSTHLEVLIYHSTTRRPHLVPLGQVGDANNADGPRPRIYSE